MQILFVEITSKMSLLYNQLFDIAFQIQGFKRAFS